MEIMLVAAALFVVYWNGANDNFKGFATVWGSETLDYRRALLLATAATIAGSLTSWWLAGTLVQQFSGRGLVPDAVVNAPQFIAAVGMGAALTVLLATRIGLPISTTHALIGGLVGAGLAQPGAEVRYVALAGLFLLPLLASPLLAASLGFGASRLVKRLPANDCACVVAPSALAPPVGAMMVGTASPTVLIAPESECQEKSGVVVRLSLTRAGDRAHIASATLICFARGVNDTPKLAALLIAGSALDVVGTALAIAAVMAAGGLLHASRVAVTMSRRVTRMDHRQGLAANLVTATLVLFASKLGMPVSTTHVSVGAIAGMGASAGTVDRATLRGILLSWAATLPLAAGLAWTAAMLVGTL
ncbi:MAG: inorganic phosphate transporter [Betaproteobacteria bacterium HGW-Betaproteobacteria-11]|nr:MAG: inorganic phosphate transporter [Betaproteobacteria bacterium HGW-Betaproteobacteria-11]